MLHWWCYLHTDLYGLGSHTHSVPSFSIFTLSSSSCYQASACRQATDICKLMQFCDPVLHIPHGMLWQQAHGTAVCAACTICTAYATVAALYRMHSLHGVLRAPLWHLIVPLHCLHADQQLTCALQRGLGWGAAANLTNRLHSHPGRSSACIEASAV